jgi:hypothetical protein
VANHAGDLGINKLLSNGVANFRIGLVIFSHQLELDRVATNLDPLGIGLFERQTRTVFIVLAQMGDATR